MRLDLSQKKAVATDGHVLISACAGAGKTEVLSRRGARLLSHNPEGRLLATTFTNEGAGELKKRILAHAGDQAGGRIGAGTFHTLALTQLKRAGMKPRLIDPGMQQQFCIRAWEASGRFDVFEEAQRRMETERFRHSLDKPVEDAAAQTMLQRYKELLKQGRTLDFYDLIELAVTGMRDGTIPPYSADWLLVDESQDMDALQYEWIRLHGQAGAWVTLVGDDDQTIYGWRFALGYAGLQRFVQEFDAATLTLPTNYRCGSQIVTHAANLIRHNAKRIDKRLRSGTGTVGKVQVLSANDRMAEALMACQRIQDDGRYDRWAIISRTNRRLDPAELLLTQAGIPVRRIGGKGFWTRPVPSLMLSLLGSLYGEPWMPVSMALHAAGVPVTHLEQLQRRVSRLPTSKWASLTPDKPLQEGLTRKSAAAMHSLLSLYDEWRVLAANGRAQLAISGVARWMQTAMQKDQQHVGWAANDLCRRSGSLKQRIARARQPLINQTPDTPHVQLITLHASKGLQWPAIWIVGLEQERLPHKDSPLEDERRLFYVGLTRGREEVYLSWTRDAPAGPSPFLNEAKLPKDAGDPDALQVAG